MKRILFATLLFVVLAVTPAFAADSNSTKATYKVTLNVIYNAVSAEEAAKITKESLLKHDKACKNSVTVGKNSNVYDTVGFATIVSIGQ